MIRINFVKLPLNYNQKTIENAVCKELRIDKRAIEHFTLNRLSVDARKKTDIKFIATIDVFLKTNESTVLSKAKNINAAKALPYEYNFLVNKEGFGTNPVVVGSGPAGLFAAYILAKGGTNPIVIERGSQVAARVQDVESFWLKGQFNPASNVQFGEGGAGTFSDGKLTAGSKDTRKNLVLQTFAENGAPPEILYTAKPHIGTDYLRKVVVNIRKQTIALGGKFLFNTQLIDVKTKENIVVAAVVKNEESAYKIDTDCIVLAIGHSARDTFEMLNDKK
ncbi:MAG: FAD-binding protein, partial [Oscillospiraceae bacterium]|nr:FAD-binding protein [Oscillospiraceae bacterium]